MTADVRSIPTGVVAVVYASPEHAEIARRTIAADGELKPLKITKEYEVVGSELRVTVHATEIRLLRVALNSLFDMLQIVAQTLNSFGTEDEEGAQS